ncbi:MAG: barstar family protein [Azonexus sp.]|jgi:hypothetical protein|uniref:barstar family protein n=1 Tax=Azonexus sp. TaxID=1872668 RepID=UPI0028195AB8|nr:barstar family protein [Azonexus sp.]MDR0776137.1 barstar family protein [Azonexus sp.]
MSKPDNITRLLADSSRAGLYHLPAGRRTAVEQGASRAGFRLLTTDLSPCRSKAAALAALGRACAFPEWHGGNLDALLDALCDPDWLPAPGHILLITGLDSLRQAAPDSLAVLQEVFSAACDERRASGQPLWILIDTPATGIDPFPDA